MTSYILLTGATGFLGTQVALNLLRNTDASILTLVRAGDHQAALQRLRREWWDWPELIAALGERVSALSGDICQPNLGLPPQDYQRLAEQVTHIIHTAADVRLFAPIDVLRQVNVTGTRHLLELARAAHQGHGLQRFAHVSTAYVAGARSGPVAEAELTDRYGFSSPYERSKYEAERLVREASELEIGPTTASPLPPLPVSIFRPGMIVGDSHSGAVKAFNTLYYPLRLYMTSRLRIAPARPDLRVDLVPVDYVASAITRLTFDPRAAGLTFHLTASPDKAPRLDEFIHFTRGWARREQHLRLPRPVFLPVPGLGKLAALPMLRTLVKHLAGRDAAALPSLLAYFQKQPVFLRDNTDRLAGPYPHRWQDLLPPLLEYAVRHSFWHRTSRTVHEQILYRLNSRTRPVIFHDLAAAQTDPAQLVQTTRPAVELQAEVLAAARAFRVLGIQPGQRIAILGANSTRYFSSVLACGLAGAVSVPLYPTLPLEELGRLLEDCQARMLLIDAPEVLARLGKLHFTGPVVSICDPSGAAPGPGAQNVYDWSAFLALGRDQSQPLPQVMLDAPAVLFYTSGTTGRPKAVIYRHDQLRWLAEALAALYPWRERNRWGAYLSYLPMSHVVEGILATYSPYYVPAALDIYFLHDFHALPQALKLARPTIFFSVPRFFEKVRAAFLQNRLARFYLRTQAGPLRNLLRPLLRRGLLRKAGLDRARQMLVGSAPTSTELLAFFQELGIPIHNAYGLTEAPLVSVNRLGHNQVDTVGEVLPETSIHFGPDGEVLIAGPQVADGYLEGGRLHPFPEGWFSTGDLGRLSAEGFLSLHGRKKDILITAYGENILPTAIETRLRAIPGVAEVLLVGDGRPYCAALFWLEEPTCGPQIITDIQEGVTAINLTLPRPARVRRWAVVRGNLTVANGCLTASMKVKRVLVTERMKALIEALYQNETTPEILYCQGLKPEG